jgi:hypothetical protein
MSDISVSANGIALEDIYVKISIGGWVGDLNTPDGRLGI